MSVSEPPAPTLHGYGFYFVTRWNSTHIHSSGQLVAWLLTLWSRRVCFQQHNLKVSLLRLGFYYLWWSTTDQRLLFCQSTLYDRNHMCTFFRALQVHLWLKKGSNLFQTIISLNLLTLRIALISLIYFLKTIFLNRWYMHMALNLDIVK